MHELVATQTGTNVPAILMALVFVAIGRSASFYLSDLQRNKIEAEYNSRCYLAFLSYEISKLKEFRQYRQQLCDAWLLYTGEHFPITASYQMVMESDIETRRHLERHLQIYDTGRFRLSPGYGAGRERQTEKERIGEAKQKATINRDNRNFQSFF